ncbi:MAG: protein-glutamate O-methyltransferase CheR [Spongiibacteraceae bacterium]|jgi:chemotaxis protein methyltransferase CheR|nr:protein-glutamate O-methyltransferase CheR [Spongiibacteraceae bacterium]
MSVREPDRNGGWPVAELERLLEALYRRYHHDFRNYARPSVARRVERALAVFGCESVRELEQQVLDDANAFERLLQILTVPVSEMFRDPGYFLTLRQQVVPLLQTYPSLKVWVAGCSTGEEAYSLAILLDEEGLLERTLIYATDINEASLDTARQGIFPLREMQRYTENYQQAGGRGAFSSFYTAAYDGALLDKRLRTRIVFADHSLATDSVFSATHLVSCRNVLIYFDKRLQNRALSLFHESLCPFGFLGLGSRESLEFTDYNHCFEPVSRPERIYRKRSLPE